MSPRTWTIELPYTSPPLRDNDRMHWAVKARTTAELRQCGWALARSAKVPHLDRAQIMLGWQPTTRRRRDIFGPVPTLKPLVDGLVDAGVLDDDDISRCLLACQIEDEPAKPGRLWLEITDLTALAAVPANPNGAEKQ